jgi:hypothetical protein
MEEANYLTLKSNLHLYFRRETFEHSSLKKSFLNSRHLKLLKEKLSLHQDLNKIFE